MVIIMGYRNGWRAAIAALRHSGVATVIRGIFEAGSGFRVA